MRKIKDESLSGGRKSPSAGSSGNQQFPDEKVLHLASEQGRALVTLNRKHFIRLHHLNKKHGGIIVCSMDLDYPGQAHRIHQAVKSCASLAGLLIRVNRPA